MKQTPMKVVRLFAAALLALQISLAAFADGSAADTRAAFLRVIDRPRVALKPELAEMAPVEGLRKYHLWFSSDATERVPGYLLLAGAQRSSRAARPVVIALHGTGGTKDSRRSRQLVLKAAQAGFIGVAIDGRFHGERTKAGTGAAEYNAAIARAFKTGEGHPFYYDTAWDVMRLIDYLAHAQGRRRFAHRPHRNFQGRHRDLSDRRGGYARRRCRALHRRAEFQMGAGQRPVARAHRDDSGSRSMRRRQWPASPRAAWTSCASSTRAWCRASMGSSTDPRCSRPSRRGRCS